MTEDFEYFEGTKTIQHEDGSTTYITTYHEPYVEPLTGKQQVAVIGGLALLVAGAVATPFIADRWVDWSLHRKEVRELKRQKKLKDLQESTND